MVNDGGKRVLRCVNQTSTKKLQTLTDHAKIQKPTLGPQGLALEGDTPVIQHDLCLPIGLVNDYLHHLWFNLQYAYCQYPH